MTAQVLLRRTSHLLLTPTQIPIPRRKPLQLVLTWHLDPTIRIHAHHGILVEEQSVENDAPFARSLFEEEEEAAVGFVVHFDAVFEGEAAGYGDFHFGDGAGVGGSHVHCLAIDAVEDLAGR